MEETTQDTNKKKPGIVKIIGIVIIIVVLGLAIFKLVSSKENPKDLQTIEQQGPKEIFTQKETRIENGVQIVELSWGRLNYNPEVIKVKHDMPVKIIADTERLTGCFRSLVIPEFNVRKSFTESDNTVEFTPTKIGTFSFTCAMGMGRGRMVVE